MRRFYRYMGMVVMPVLFVVKYFVVQSLAAGAASIVRNASETCHDDCRGDII
mgnify:CR=1 FL=1